MALNKYQTSPAQKLTASQETIKVIAQTMEIKGQVLGEGGYAKVHTCWNRQTQEMVAAKIISKIKILEIVNKRGNPQKKKNFYIKSLQNEVQIMRSLQHQNILQIHRYHESDSNLYFFVEYCNQGTLQQLILKQGKISYKIAINLFQDLIEACLYLEKQGIVHRDIKPSNILIHNGRAKLSDFGFAIRLHEENQLLTSYAVGTEQYMAPEALNGLDVDEKADVWSLGVTFYQMLFGRLPWPSLKGTGNIKQVSRTPLTISGNVQIPLNIKVGLRRMLNENKNLRASIQEIKDIFCQ